MSTTKRKSVDHTYRVSRPMGEDGRMTVRPLGRLREYDVVEYGDAVVEERLASLSRGAAVRLDLSPAEPSGGSSGGDADGPDGYVATRVRPGAGPRVL